MLKKIAIVFLALAAVLVVVILTRPPAFRVARSAAISAPPDAVFSLVNDFHQWSSWSPWEKLDPSMKRTFEGPASGKGAVYAWSGNDQVGAGRMTINESKPSDLVEIKLEFIKPWTATNKTSFSIAPTEGGSMVTWAMEGENNFMAKAFSLFMNMDKMVGKDFEQGLAGMKTIAEAEAKKREEEAKKAAETAAAAAAAGAAAAETPPVAEAPAKH